jgi:alkylation response protein AidB-like acyl-CoA dehydrogenase
MTDINGDTVRAEARAWLEANWSPDYGLVEWRLKLAQSGWGVPHWPRHWYGRDLPVGLVPVVEEEFRRIGAVGVAKVGIRAIMNLTEQSTSLILYIKEIRNVTPYRTFPSLLPQ